MKSYFKSMSIVGLLTLIVLAGCSKSNDLAPYKPEISNSTDNFQLQATGVKNLTTTLTYDWKNTGVMANINKSGVVTSGEARVTLYDAANSQVYQGNLKTTGTEQSTAEVSGSWKIKLELINMSGDLNFRVQKR